MKMTFDQAKEILESAGIVLEAVPYREPMSLDKIIESLTVLRKKLGNTYVKVTIPRGRRYEDRPIVAVNNVNGFISIEADM